jgi:hypothetical protein
MCTSQCRQGDRAGHRATAISSYTHRTKNPIGAQRPARHASIETTIIYVHEVNRLEDPPEAYIDYGN